MDRGTIFRVWLPLAGGLWALGFIYEFGPGPHRLARLLGLLLSLVGLAGVIVARYTLGASFSVAAKATALVTSGIYSRIRNPIYISGELFIAGVVVMIWKPYLLLILLALIPVQIVRAPRSRRPGGKIRGRLPRLPGRHLVLNRCYHFSNEIGIHQTAPRFVLCFSSINSSGWTGTQTQPPACSAVE
jgi:Phospholipid methyltransferase